MPLSQLFLNRKNTLVYKLKEIQILCLKYIPVKGHSEETDPTCLLTKVQNLTKHINYFLPEKKKKNQKSSKHITLLM